MGYPQGLLATRAIVKAGEYAIIPPEGRVNNVLPNIEGCRMSILCSPKLGASFVMYIGTAEPGGGTVAPFAAEQGVESFLFILDGKADMQVSVAKEEHILSVGGYAYAPPSSGLSFKNNGSSKVRFLLYKQRYITYADKKPYSVVGNINAIEEQIYDGMENVFVRDLLPLDLGFDMNFHTLSFEPGGSHNFVETHVQEHGAYIYEGEGVYLIGDEWTPVQKDDFIFFGPFTPQAVYASGRGRLTYIYSKDCNRDVAI